MSWFGPSAAVQPAALDCPHGLNPDTIPNVLRMLKEQRKNPAEIKAAMADFPNNVYDAIGMRGRIGGKPANPYLNPLSVPDPKLKLVEGQSAHGFNLDGNEATGGFTDPETGEKGVDNQLFRAYGCTAVVRADPGVRPSWPTIQWKNAQLQMPAWVVEIGGIDDWQNDDAVEVRIVGATAPVQLESDGGVRADMTFVESANPVTQNRVRGAIRNGVLTTEAMPSLNLNGHRWAWPEMRWKNARLRLTFAADGTARGMIGGYHRWAPLYVPQMEGGSGFEATLSMDVPGMYHAFRKLADAEPDPETGLNLSISTAFDVELVPAFVVHPSTKAQDAAAQAQAADPTVMATPPGVLLRVIRIGRGVDLAGSNTSQARERVVFADDRGRVMYAWDGDRRPNRSTCGEGCAEIWLPAAAPVDARPVGLWTIVNRDGGVRQWAFRGRPLYFYAPEQKGAVALPVDKNPAIAAKAETAEGLGQDVDGHQVMEIQPEQWIATPPGFHIREVRMAPGYVLTNARGLPLYTFDGMVGEAREQGPLWKPVLAAPLSVSVGDFATVSRPDGDLQWTYKGKPLFSFAGDITYGDASGKGGDVRFQIAFVLRYFMPDGVTIRSNRIYGGLLTLSDGTKLYARDTLNGGFSGALNGDRGKRHIGEKIGVPPCDDVCQKEWKPLLAADGAKPSGYWTLYDRGDGSRQWAYFGYALYSPAKPGVVSTEIYDEIRHFEPLPDGRARQNIPPHWRVAPP